VDNFATTFAIVPAFEDFDFFKITYQGCLHEARGLGKNVQCWYRGPETFDPTGRLQAQVINNLTLEGKVDGMSVSVVNEGAVREPIARAVDAGIKVVTFDSDAPSSERAAYIGTDNSAYGQRLASVLDQVNPEGGKYVIVTAMTPSVTRRTEAFREDLKDKPWNELNGGSATIFYNGSSKKTLEDLAQLVDGYPYPHLNAIVVMLPKLVNSRQWKDLVDENSNMTFVAADLGDEEINLLQQNYISALVGQHPYEMGELSARTLYQLINEGETVPNKIFGTALVEVVRVPVDLPPPNVNQNYIGNFRIMGYVLYAVAVMFDIGFLAWTVARRKDRVVRASQPEFLILICVGSLILVSSIIPMGVDDEIATQKQASSACMIKFWLLSVGFVLVQSALFAKTWRVNRIFHNPNKFKRVKVTAKDVILPLVGLLAANIVVMICWQLLNPLVYVRHPHSGTDPWNRIISTYGACTSKYPDQMGGTLPYLISLGAIDLGALLLANVQAYQARNLSTEFSESKYIAMAMTGMLQVGIVGTPVLILVHDIPRTAYVLLVLMVFLATMGVLLLMFMPKIIAHREWKEKQEKKRREKADRLEARTEALTEVQACAPGHGATTPSSADDGAQGLKVSLRKEPDGNDVEAARCGNEDSAGLSVVKLVKEL